MRAISLWQPHASAIATGAKLIETRSWRTNYRGPLAIHASKRQDRDELLYYSTCEHWFGALSPLGASMVVGRPLEQVLPFGAIVAVCEIVDCRRVEDFDDRELDATHRPPGDPSDRWAWTERQMGNFTAGRFGFVLQAIEALAKPVPCAGALNVWQVPEHIEKAVLAQLDPAGPWGGHDAGSR